MIHSNHRLTVREAAEEVGFQNQMSWDSQENLGMYCVAAKFVLCLLSEDQKQNRVKVSTQFVNRANADENIWLWGHNSSWISTSWPDGGQEILFEGGEKAERGSEEIRAWFVEGKKNGGSGKFLPSDPQFSHKTWDDARPPTSVLTRPCTSGLLALQQAEIHTGRMTIWVCPGD